MIGEGKALSSFCQLRAFQTKAVIKCLPASSAFKHTLRMPGPEYPGFYESVYESVHDHGSARGSVRGSVRESARAVVVNAQPIPSFLPLFYRRPNRFPYHSHRTFLVYDIFSISLMTGGLPPRYPRHLLPTTPWPEDATAMCT